MFLQTTFDNPVIVYLIKWQPKHNCHTYKQEPLLLFLDQYKGSHKTEKNHYLIQRLYFHIILHTKTFFLHFVQLLKYFTQTAWQFDIICSLFCKAFFMFKTLWEYNFSWSKIRLAFEFELMLSIARQLCFFLESRV